MSLEIQPLVNYEDTNIPNVPSQPENYTYIAKKIAFYTLKGVAALFYIPLQIITLIPNIISYVSHKELHNQINQARLIALTAGLESFPSTSQEDLLAQHAEDVDYQKLIHCAFKIKYFLEAERHPNTIRALINQGMQLPAFQNRKTQADPLVDFLQILAIQEISANGKEALRAYGANITGDLQESSSWGALADQLDAPSSARFAFQRNSKISTLFWAIAHPFHALHSIESSWFPLEYNAYAGNPNIYAHDMTLNFQQEEKTLHFYYGPGPTGDSLYRDGVLAWMEKTGRNLSLNICELRQNFQNIHQHAEGIRSLARLFVK